MIVYARKDTTVIWSDNNKAHKAGRVPIHEPLTVIKESSKFYVIERPTNLSLPPQPSYPHYFVDQGDTYEQPPDVPGAVSDTQMLTALMTVLRWLKQ